MSVEERVEKRVSIAFLFDNLDCAAEVVEDADSNDVALSNATIIGVAINSEEDALRLFYKNG